ncbi:trypsin-like peptidase domain-containing protein [Psychrosphaera ytuae]|uniref:Trypsin-like peptidase domain-containing protein n=1 Tax=Psychrosphaera ytuae TaxID=2820710 RepID=A0A975DAB7_9GAMM|nr:serine protease [Psychrosphaera ytuae]QTH63099.1 trypsin-like peptidase domain-containing protein [Psychrosphaera ytuae]
MKKSSIYSNNLPQKLVFFIALVLLGLSQPSLAESLIQTASTTKQSVVGVGVYNPLSAPRYQLLGTGFVIDSSATKSIIATNHHVVNGPMFDADKAEISVHVGESKKAQFYRAKLLAQDQRADVALLEVNVALPALALEDANKIAPAASQILIAGLPIGSVLGLFKAVHVGYVAAYVPQAIPQSNSSQLSIEMIKRLRDPLFVYQLDITAYPGNSGSPVVDVTTGKVIAIINSVLVKSTREQVLSDPSGISYAIPVSEIHKLLKTIKTKG